MNEMFFDISFPTLFIYTLHFELLDYNLQVNLQLEEFFHFLDYVQYIYTVQRK